jgi:hypothetical protein
MLADGRVVRVDARRRQFDVVRRGDDAERVAVVVDDDDGLEPAVGHRLRDVSGPVVCRDGEYGRRHEFGGGRHAHTTTYGDRR